MRSTTLGAAVQLAPVGALGRLIVHGVDWRTSIAKTSHFPSGDQRRSLGASTTRVTWEVAPSASIHRTNSCVPFGSPSARYAMREPSGAQRAFDPLVRKRLREPSAFMIHSADSHLSSIRFTHVRV
jgi:hypothetical protein